MFSLPQSDTVARHEQTKHRISRGQRSRVQMFLSHVRPKICQLQLNIFTCCTGAPDIQEVGFKKIYKNVFFNKHKLAEQTVYYKHILWKWFCKLSYTLIVFNIPQWYLMLICFLQFVKHFKHHHCAHRNFLLHVLWFQWNRNLHLFLFTIMCIMHKAINMQHCNINMY